MFNHDTVLKHGLICAINKVMFFLIFLLISNDVCTVLCDLKKLAQTLNIYTLVEMLERVVLCMRIECVKFMHKFDFKIGTKWAFVDGHGNVHSAIFSDDYSHPWMKDR